MIGLRGDDIHSVVLRRGSRGLCQNRRAGGYGHVGNVRVRGSVSYGELFVVDNLSRLWPARQDMDVGPRYPRWWSSVTWVLGGMERTLVLMYIYLVHLRDIFNYVTT